jgi:uncharacterized protein (TIGR02996 family)
VSDRAAFLAAIKAAPADDTLRLVFADWLQEQDTERDRRHAEMIRFQIDLARTPHNHNGGRDRARRPGTGPQCPRCAKNRLDAQNFAAWANEHLVERVFDCRCLFRRGFVESVVCGSSEWLYGRDSLLAHHPLERLVIDCFAGDDLRLIGPAIARIPEVAVVGIEPRQWPNAIVHFTAAGCTNKIEFYDLPREEYRLRTWFGRGSTHSSLLDRRLFNAQRRR